MSLVMTLVPFLVLWNSKSCFATPFSCFYNWIRFAADVNAIGGGLLAFPGTASSAALDSVPGTSVSMFAVCGLRSICRLLAGY
jgi:hypothetical protein